MARHLPDAAPNAPCPQRRLLCNGLLTERVSLVSDALHLTFRCGFLSFSLFAMSAFRTKPDSVYSYGYKRLGVLAAFADESVGAQVSICFGMLTDDSVPIVFYVGS